jgi:hypothetical protein
MILKQTVKIWKNRNVRISYIARSVIRFSARKDSFKVINLHIHPSIPLNEDALDALFSTPTLIIAFDCQKGSKDNLCRIFVMRTS